MARKKVQLRYIEDAAARKASFKKRRQGLLKKVEELSILCDVTACVVVYGEDPREPLVHWPGDCADVERALWKYEESPDMERWKRTVTQEDYVRERIEKFAEQLKKVRRSIRDMEMYRMMQLVYLDGKSHGEFTTSELKSLHAFAEEKVNELERKARFLLEISNAPTASSAFANFRGFARYPLQGEGPLGPTTLGTVFPYGASCGGTGITASVSNGYLGSSTYGYAGAAPGLQNPMLGGIAGVRGYDTQASMTLDIDDINRGGANGNLEPQNGGSRP